MAGLPVLRPSAIACPSPSPHHPGSPTFRPPNPSASHHPSLALPSSPAHRCRHPGLEPGSYLVWCGRSFWHGGWSGIDSGSPLRSPGMTRCGWLSPGMAQCGEREVVGPPLPSSQPTPPVIPAHPSRHPGPPLPSSRPRAGIYVGHGTGVLSSMVRGPA